MLHSRRPMCSALSSREPASTPPAWLPYSLSAVYEFARYIPRGPCSCSHVLVPRTCSSLHMFAGRLVVLLPQEMSLEEYEAVMAERKKALNKQAEAKNVDSSAELKGLKVFTKQSTEEQVRWLTPAGLQPAALWLPHGPFSRFWRCCVASALLHCVAPGPPGGCAGRRPVAVWKEDMDLHCMKT